MNNYLKVHSLEWVGEGIFELRCERNGIEFQPGDCIALFGADEETSRPYSCASAPDDDLLRFIIRKMEGGVVSPHLAARTPGEEVKCSPPFGWFRPGKPANGGPFVFVATGTGIAPFLSYLRSSVGDPPVQCLYGVRKLGDAVEREWLSAACDFRLCVSREEAEGCHQGRVTDLLDELPMGETMNYYLCGVDAMLDEVTGWLEGQGVEITQIHRECFFNAAYCV